MFLIDMEIQASSANRLIVYETLDGKMRNSNGPSTVPCGTHDVTTNTNDVTLVTVTF